MIQTNIYVVNIFDLNCTPKYISTSNLKFKTFSNIHLSILPFNSFSFVSGFSNKMKEKMYRKNYKLT